MNLYVTYVQSSTALNTSAGPILGFRVVFSSSIWAEQLGQGSRRDLCDLQRHLGRRRSSRCLLCGSEGTLATHQRAQAWRAVRAWSVYVSSSVSRTLTMFEQVHVSMASVHLCSPSTVITTNLSDSDPATASPHSPADSSTDQTALPLYHLWDSVQGLAHLLGRN